MIRVPLESPEEARWREAALGGPKPRSLADLTAKTADDLPIEPIYLPRHLFGLEPRGEPGGAPFVRAPGGAWLVAQHYQQTEPETLARAVREDRAVGVDVAWLSPRDTFDSVAQRALGPALAGSGISVWLDAGEAAPGLYEALAADGIQVEACFDPLAALARQGALTESWETQLRAARGLLDRASAVGHGSPLAVSAAVVHEAGGTPAQEIGFALACAAEMARALEPLGPPPESTLAAMTLVVSPGTDVLAGVVKVRALRLAWQKLATALGKASRPFIAGITSERALSQLDMPTNMIRATLETTSLILGGADLIVTRAYDELAPESERSRVGARLAKNTQLVLRDEAHLGRVADPAGGAYYVESMTDALARSAWAELRAIEKEGGVRASLASGAFPARVAAARLASAKLVATKRRVLVGVNDFADISESAPEIAASPFSGPLAPVRAADAFERIRARAGELAKLGRRPRVLLACLGEPSDHRAREEFSRRFFEVGGFYVDSESGADAGWIHAAVQRTGVPVVVLCSSDERYAALGAEAVREAKAGGADTVILAGRPAALEAALRGAGLDLSIHFGCDAIPILEAALEGKGANS